MVDSGDRLAVSDTSARPVYIILLHRIILLLFYYTDAELYRVTIIIIRAPSEKHTRHRINRPGTYTILYYILSKPHYNI